MCLVHDEQIPAQASILAGLRGATELLEHVGLLEVVIAGDDAIVGTPGIRIDADLALELEGLWPVDRLEGQGEFVLHLVTPLGAKRGRAEDEHSADAATEHQLAEHHTGLNSFTEADGIRQQEGHAGHLEGAQDRNELVGLGMDGAIERGGERRAIVVQP